MRLLIFLIIPFLFACEEVSVDMTYNISCQHPGTIEGTVIPATDVVGYGFYADTALYAPESFQQAISGKISAIKTIGELQSDIEAVFTVENGLISFKNLKKEGEIIFVLSDKINEIYAYRQFEVVADLLEINTYLVFDPNDFVENPTNTTIVNGWILKK